MVCVVVVVGGYVRLPWLALPEYDCIPFLVSVLLVTGWACGGRRRRIALLEWRRGSAIGYRIAVGCRVSLEDPFRCSCPREACSAPLPQRGRKPVEIKRKY